jgi:hypothetical protein
MTLPTPHKANRRFAGVGNVGGVLRGNGDSHDLATRNPEPPKGGEAYTGCYMPFANEIHIFKYLLSKLKKAIFFYNIKSDGKCTRSSGALAGNKVYAHRREMRMNGIADLIGNDKKKWIFVTLTKWYLKTDEGRKKSWQEVHEELPKFLRKMRQLGMEEYIWVKEAHRDGGCHVHILMKWNKEIKTRQNKGKVFIKSEQFRGMIKDCWEGNVDVKPVLDDGVRGYITKELGKFSHVEDALKRAKRDWSKEGDKKFYDGDWKRMWTYYFSDILKIRLHGMSRNIKVEEGASLPDLINNMTNTTEQEKAQTIAVMKVPNYIKRNHAFEPFNGTVDPDSKEMELLRELYEKTYGRKLNE